MSAMLKFLVFVTQLVVIFAELPPIQKCQLADSSCLKSSAQAALPVFVAGMPEIDVETLDPMKIDNIKVNLAGLKLSMDDVVIKGLKKATIASLNVDMAKKQMTITWESDFVLKSHYKASGRLLILPISGDGDCTIKLKKLDVEMTINFDISKNADGKDVIELKNNYKYKFDVKENAHFSLTNLFNGNKVLSDAMLNFMNENWKTLAAEFGQSMLERPVQRIFDGIKKYLKSQPLEEIVLN